MCDPFTLIAGALTAGTSLLGAKQKAPKPPPLPAVAAPAATESNADVRANTDEDEELVTPDYVGFAPKRTAASTVGGLGRSGLAL